MGEVGSYTEWLRARDNNQLTTLLERRPYLATPAPSSFASLAGRATSRSATQRALAEVDTAGLQVLRAVLVLGEATSAQVTQALGPSDDEERTQVADALADLCTVGLVWDDDDDVVRAAPGVVGLLDPDGRHRNAPKGDEPLFTITRPVHPEPTWVPALTVAAESCRAAGDVVTAVERLVDAWSDPPTVARRGGLGMRELRRTAGALGTTEADAAFVVELAFAASLVVIDLVGPSRVFVPTPEADTWAGADLPERWAVLAGAWLTSTRTPWLVGTKDDQGTVRLVGHPEGSRPWLPGLRRAVLGVLADAHDTPTDADEPAVGALSADQVHDVLAWRTPLAVPPADVIVPLLTEATRLGVTGAGGLARAGLALLSDDDPAAALAADLPPAVDEVWLQADLTGVVPGRPCDRLARLLRRAATTESSGGALTVRFTPASVDAAVASAHGGDLLADLAEFSRGPLPQGLEYLVRDAVRRHDVLRTGPATAYVRSDDEALLTRIVADPTLAGCCLVRVAPTVVVAAVGPVQLAESLAAAGLPARTESPDGHLVDLTPPRRAHPRATRSHRPTATDVHVVVARLRADPGSEPDAQVPPDDEVAVGIGAWDPLDTAMVLREAVDQHTEVWVDLIDDAGDTTRHRLRPVAFDEVRLRALDDARAVEITVVTSRIASAAPVSPTLPQV